MTVGKEIGLLARKKGICDEWFKKMLKTTHIETLCKMYFDGDDWATKNDFPNAELLRKFKGNSERYRLFVDNVGSYVNFEKSAFFGESNVELHYTDFYVGKVYLRHSTKSKITVKNNAILYVYVFDDTEVHISCQDKAKVTVYNYSSKNNIHFSGDVIVKNKTWEKQ